jgi:hypothetical protein
MFMKKLFRVFLIVTFILAIGAHIVETQDKSVITLRAEPSQVEINPKTLAEVKIIGTGFRAEDRVLIVFAGADKGKDVAVGSAEADASGSFETKMDMLSILQGIFHFRFSEGKPIPDPNNPPLPPAKYKLSASSWDSGLVAVCDLEIIAPVKK